MTKSLPVSVTVWFCLAGLLFTVAVRFFDLAYNAPFNDEAIYIVVGRLGLFEGDWWSYNAQSWMAGLPYIYPPLAALASVEFGFVGARLLSAVISLFIVLEIFRIARKTPIYGREYANLAGLISALVAAMSGVGLFISRLATYDALAILFLLLAFDLLLGEEKKGRRHYFFSALFFVLAVATKIITGAYLLPLLLLSMRKLRDKCVRSLWLRFYLLPLCILMLLLMAINLEGFLQYTRSQVDLEQYGYSAIFGFLWGYISVPLLLAIPFSAAALVWGDKKMTAFLVLCALLLPTIHLINHRFATLDKHSYFFVIFSSVLIGHGIAALLRTKYARSISLPVFLVGFVYYAHGEIRLLRTLEQDWADTREVTAFLRDQVQTGDKVLFEEGSSGILGLYGVTSPHNVTTFDWFNYQGLTGDQAYEKAVEDKYFRFIQLSQGKHSHPGTTDTILDRLPGRYYLVYDLYPLSVFEALPLRSTPK